MTDFSVNVRTVLQQKNYPTSCVPLDELVAVVDKTARLTAWKVFTYKWGGFLLLLLIPILSAALSFMLSAKPTSDPATPPVGGVAYVSMVLTLLTILNSIFKPGERFRQACLMGIGIDRFAATFLVALEKEETVNERSLLELVETKRAEFEKFQIELIGMFMPMETIMGGWRSGKGKK